MISDTYLAIFIAAIASFGFGAIWYTALSRFWLAARGMPQNAAETKTGDSPLPFVISFVALLIMAAALSGVLLHLSRGGTTMSVRSGAITGLLLWLGFVMTTMAVNHAFHGERRLLTLIDGGHWLGVLLIQGAILGWWLAG